MKIVIVEENQIVRLGIFHILQRIAGQIDSIGVASLTDCQSFHPDIKPDIALKVVRKSEQVDHVITQFVHQVRALFPGVFVILISGDLRKSTIRRYLASGVNGYLDKTADVSELQNCIEKVVKGDRYLNVEIIYSLLREKSGVQARGTLQPRKTTTSNSSNKA